MQQITEKYLMHLDSVAKQPRTIQAIKETILRFELFIKKDLKEVTQDDIMKWSLFLKSRNNATQTRAVYMQHITTLFDFLIENGYYTDRNPARITLKGLNRAPSNKIRKTTVLSPEDVKKIVLKAVNPRDRSMCLLFYKTGMRLSELQQLKKTDINIDTKTITIPKRKGGSEGIVIFDEEVSRWLKAYFTFATDKKPFGIHPRNIEKIVKSIGIRAGFPSLRPHDFRHAFTTHLSGNRCHPEIIRELRGDSKKDMVSYYTHFTEAQVREEYNRCIPKLGV